VAFLLLDTVADKVGLGVAIVVFLVIFACALRAWWSELKAVEELASNFRPNRNHFKRGVKR